MKENVKVCLTGIHAREGERSEKIVTHAMGRYREIPDGCEICYEEQNGDERVGSTVRIYDDKMEIIRSGAYGSEMIFEEGGVHHTDYATPYGKMDMIIRTGKLEILRQEEELRIDVEYGLEMEGRELSQAVISLEIMQA